MGQRPEWRDPSPPAGVPGPPLGQTANCTKTPALLAELPSIHIPRLSEAHLSCYLHCCSYFSPRPVSRVQPNESISCFPWEFPMAFLLLFHLHKVATEKERQREPSFHTCPLSHGQSLSRFPDTSGNDLSLWLPIL